jgi:geranylgeranyl diphosphate synthase type I
VTYTGTVEAPPPAGTADLGPAPGIEAELAAYLAARTADAAAIDPSFARATESLSAFVLGGGKRIRPTFAWWGWRGGGGSTGAPEAAAVLRAISAL